MAIACILVEVVFDEQLSEFGVLVVDSNGKASIVAGADEIVDYVPEVLFFLFILLGHLIAVIKLNIISGINRLHIYYIYILHITYICYIYIYIVI